MSRRRTFPTLFTSPPKKTSKMLQNVSLDDMHICVKRIRKGNEKLTSCLSSKLHPLLKREMGSKFKRARCSSDPSPIKYKSEETSSDPPLTASSISYSSTLVKDRVFRLPELRFKNIQYVGEGTYGVVVSALDASTNQKVAIKKCVPFGHDVHTRRVWREIFILRNLEYHENIIDIKHLICVPNSLDEVKEIYVVQSLMDFDMFKLLNKQHLTTDHICYFLYQILRGLKYIHSANILHRDLKPSNLLVNQNCDLKICDFSMSRYIIIHLIQWFYQNLTVSNISFQCHS